MIETLSVVCWGVMATCAVINTVIQYLRYQHDCVKITVQRVRVDDPDRWLNELDKRRGL